MPTASTSAFPPSAPCPVAVPSDGKDHPVALDSVEEAVKAIAAGEFVVVVDDMDRENEGDRMSQFLSRGGRTGTYGSRSEDSGACGEESEDGSWEESVGK